MSAPKPTDYTDYADNNYGVAVRLVDEDFRAELASWQIPAHRTHFGDLTGKVFMDIGAGDLVLGERLAEIGEPAIYYVQDLSRPSLEAGLARLEEAGISTNRIVPLVSDQFDFSAVPDGSLDGAFSNSLFSHLTLNSIALCLRNLAPKMKTGAAYLSSMIVVPAATEPESYDWSHLGTKGSAVVSYPTKDPYHYTAATVHLIGQLQDGFSVAQIHDYGHPFQKLVEFRKR